MTAAGSAKAVARSLAVISSATGQRVDSLPSTAEGWTGRAASRMSDSLAIVRRDLSTMPPALSDASAAMVRFAAEAEHAEQQRTRARDLRADGDRLSQRWNRDRQDFGARLVDSPPSTIDPGSDLRWRAQRAIAEADDVERSAAVMAASSIRATSSLIRSLGIPTSAPTPQQTTASFGGIGDFFDDVLDTVADGFESGWDRTTDLGTWAAEQTLNIKNEIVRVGATAIDVSQNVVAAFAEQTRIASFRARFAPDFALFHATGNTPDELPNIGDAYRRSQNVWSYSLIPVIEETGGECTQLDNGIFACLSDGIELPGELGTIPLKGRGGTTLGEVFIIDDIAKFREVQEPGSRLAEHEKRHSEQWAIHGVLAYPGLYLSDVALSGNRGWHQYFEQQADASDGGYSP